MLGKGRTLVCVAPLGSPMYSIKLKYVNPFC